ncbi:hypothetical protein COY52_02520 [Candidatus Desantisbacteria bacterium CG_4_10_14_0_8_um_filter_48_22]|uniref:Uncharacterized protein n=1 Tax=Candidatus Desantisbacteria bacterium CG_4_10_14_0_8_um_filter_48_22 TaxID=1974543 RepID=A0A2M7SEB4_9BACT|nr:MAG: hypothetical protein AUJ67_03765 [Candidatus Desantisbacteria bacterium CG1_02_49_89]PIV56921.1 MAG: hypothetical protein COS16_02605 [Candidatus Desantisbacteria bacterium CG02_land_8_20_14_3_00_49_13]PIZ17824.1 MAG: hypothetical protein COY52_02520 [Candidatus Desantisbacteria bacterium CG_4_10_14_0_8_um_filter_48_22]
MDKTKDTKLKYRFFWTWDHSMVWTPLVDGIQEYGCSNPYYKKPEVFIQDYKNCIDFCAANNYTGVIIYGFLRDCHGGTGAAQEICKYGRGKNVRVIPGIGVNSYGGVYWEGKHEFNLSTWLDRHPELEAVGQPYPGHPYLRIGCPSKKENRKWMKDSIRWLCETFEIGGINFETGDYGLCKCEECLSKSKRTGFWSPEDIVELLPPLIKEARDARPGILPICECYFNNILDTELHKPLQALPEGSILQFCIDHVYLPQFLSKMTPEKAAKLPTHPKVIRTHMGSQWNNERRRLVAKDFAKLVKKVAEAGMDGVTLFGEVPQTSTVNEINYLSVADFCDDPKMTWEEFTAKKLSPLFGGEGLAKKYIELLEKDKISTADLESAKKALREAKGQSYRRWLWMVEYLYTKSGQ